MSVFDFGLRRSGGRTRRANVNQAIPILMYHQVTPGAVPASFRKYALTPEAFRAQMDLLARLRYTPISFDTWLAARRRAARLPARPVMITFDDGFQDAVEYAAPVLKKHEFTATFYLVAGLMGLASHWLVPERGVEYELVSWDGARRLVELGLEVGAHSLTHPRLARLTEAECRRELNESRHLLEENLGRPVRHLAFPFGSFDARVCALAAEAGYQTACSVEIGLATERDPLLALRRVPVIGSAEGDSFAARLDFLFRLRTGWGMDQWLHGKQAALTRRVARAAGVSAK